MSKPEPSEDRLPPHDERAEAAVLSCQMQDPANAIPDVITKLHGPRIDVHYDLRHQMLQKAIFELHDQAVGIDEVTLYDYLATRGELEKVGGLPYLCAVRDAAATVVNLPHYLDIVQEKWLMRQAIAACINTARNIYQNEGPVAELLDRAEADILAVNSLRLDPTTLRPMTELVAEDLVRIEDMQRGVGTIDGLRTYLAHLDKFTGGLHPGELTIIAARPSLGKTSLALSIAGNVLRWSKTPTALFSLEMTSAALVRRLLCAEAHANPTKVRTGFATLDDLQAIADIGPRVSAWKLFIDDTPALGLLDLKARARRLKARHQVQLVIVDYLQLMTGIAGKDYRGNREREVADISAGLKAMARELNVPVLALSQLNREQERNKGRKPQLADLRDSGAIEQDADQVWMLYRPKKRKDPDSGEMKEVADEPEGEVQPVNLLIAKQRNGPADWDVELNFLRPYTHFVDAYDNRGKTTGYEGAPKPKAPKPATHEDPT